MSELDRPLQAVPDPGFGQLLRATRVNRRLTQAQLGSMLGVRQQTVGAWERGESPQSRFLDALVDFLELPSRRELEQMLARGNDQRSSGGPRTPGSDSDSPTSSALESLAALANAVSSRLASGPPLTSDETATIRELVAALQGSAQTG